MTASRELIELAEYLREHGGYREVRILPDGSIAGTADLITTRAIMLGMTREGWTQRFRFSDPTLADVRFRSLKSEDDVPSGFVASRGMARRGEAETGGGSRD